MIEQGSVDWAPAWLVKVVCLLGILGLGSLVGAVVASPYGWLFVLACAGGLGSLLWFRLGPYRGLLVFVFLSHLLVWLLKLTSTVLPTQYMALLPSVVVGLLYVVMVLEVANIGFKVPVDRLDLLVAGFIAISFVQVFNDRVTVVFGLRAFQRTAFFGGMYFVGRYVVTCQERAHTVVRLMASTVALAALYAILQSVFGISLEGEYADVLQKRSGEIAVELAQQRSYGTLISQAAFGVMAAVGALCALAWLLVARNRGWWIALSSLLTSGIGLLVSGSRSSMLGLAAGVMVVGWLLAGQKILRLHRLFKVRKRVVWTSMVFVVVLILVFLFLTLVGTLTTRNTLKRLRTISPVAWLRGEVLRDRNVQGRIVAWRSIWQGIAKRPVLGYGTGVLGGSSHRKGVGDVNGREIADNQYLELWGELGILGLLLYCMILLVAWLSGRRRWCDRDVRVLGALVAGVAGVFAVVGVGAPPLDMYPANAFFWLVLGIGANVKRFRQDVTEASSS
jgi:O-antigen ligase